MAKMSAGRDPGSRCFGGVKALEFTARGILRRGFHGEVFIGSILRLGLYYMLSKFGEPGMRKCYIRHMQYRGFQSCFVGKATSEILDLLARCP
jgi:hypothetical protein